MKVSECVACGAFPCGDVRQESYRIPDIEVRPQTIRLILISEAAPAEAKDDYFGGGDSLFERTTVQAFRDAGAKADSIRDVLRLGVYPTSAVKCAKTAYAVKAGTIEECSIILENEIALFPRVAVFLLMGDVAIRAVNAIARRARAPRPIPSGSTYKIRGRDYYFQGKRAFPSYLQAGPSFYIEKSKRKMIAEDIAAALKLVRQS